MQLKRGLDTIVYDLIIEGFYQGNYKAGDKIDPSELAERFQISRTPVTLALKRLTNENILQVSNGGKYYIVIPTEKLVEEICELRYMFEAYAVSWHIHSGNPEIREELYKIAQACKEAMDVESPIDSVKSDLEFHRSMIRLTGNTCFAETYEPVLNRYISVKYILAHQYAMQRDAAKRHIEIMECLMNGEEEQAIALLKKHIYVAKELMKKDLA